MGIDFPSMVIHGNRFSIDGNPWESILIDGNPWESILIDGNPWETILIDGIDGKSILESMGPQPG